MGENATVLGLMARRASALPVHGRVNIGLGKRRSSRARKETGHGEACQRRGSIYQRKDERWVGELTLGYANGKRLRKPIYGRTQREVREKLDQARRQHEQGALALGPKQTVKGFLENWLQDTARHRLRPGTFRRYEELIRLHTLPTVGRLQLTKLTPQHLSQLYGAKLTEGLSPRTVEFLHRTLHCALKEAVLWGLIVRNPSDAVKAPKPKRPPIHPLNQEQTRRLLD